VRRDGGTVIVAPLSGAHATTFPRSVSAPQLLVYRESTSGGTPAPPPLIGTTTRGRSWSSAAVRWRKTAAGDGWALFAATLGAGPAPVASSLDDARGYLDWLAMPAPPQRARLFGTRDLLP
jgi:hypothetical protein